MIRKITSIVNLVCVNDDNVELIQKGKVYEMTKETEDCFSVILPVGGVNEYFKYRFIKTKTEKLRIV